MNAPNPSTALARVVVDELNRHGLETFVASPGSRSAATVIASSTHAGVNLRMAIDERSAGFFTLGAARATGRPGVMICTSGSAVANLVPAVVEADAAGVPLILLTSDRPPELHHTGANQTMVQTDIFSGRTRFMVTLGPAENRPDAVRLWRTTVDRAVAEAMGSPPGPVQINLAFREPTSPVSDDGRAVADPFGYPLGEGDDHPVVTPVEGRVTPNIPDELVAAVAGSDRGVIVCGESSPDAATALGSHLGWPVLVEARAGGRSEEVVTAYEHLLGRDEFAPDMVIRFGAVGVSPRLLGLLGAGVPQVMVDAHGRWWDPMRSATWAVTADPVEFTSVMTERIAASSEGRWRESWLDADRRVRTLIDEVVDSRAGLSSARVARDVAALTSRTLVVGSSLPIRDLDAFAWRTPPRVISNRGLSGIDGFVSTALGVATTDPDTVAMCGDLTLLHDANGFLIEDPPPLVLVVIDNRGGRMFELLPHARHAPDFERLFVTPHDRDFSKLADFHGIDYSEVTSPEELRDAVKPTKGIHLVHLPIDPGTDREMREQVTKATTQPRHD